jgi:predicted amidophosphoribosyltransferase
MPRLLQIDVSQYNELAPGDECFYIGEYTSHGGYGASETNRLIKNLKKEPSSSSLAELRYKNQAITFWGNKLAAHLRLASVATSVTFVPVPCSKTVEHPDYDDRMVRVMQQVASNYAVGSLDIRPVFVTTVDRASQHKGGPRLSVAELRDSMAVDGKQLLTPLRKTVIVVDDVFTQGRTFKAMQGMLQNLAGVERIAGVFLAKTVWPAPNFGDAPIF